MGTLFRPKGVEGKDLLVVIILAGCVGLLTILFGFHHPFLLGAGIGLLLALANFYLSLTLSSKALTTSLVKSEIIILFGFLFRLTVLGFIFYGLSRVSALNIIVTLVTFLIGFTLFLIWEIRVLSRGAGVQRSRGGDSIGAEESYSNSS